MCPEPVFYPVPVPVSRETVDKFSFGVQCRIKSWGVSDG